MAARLPALAVLILLGALLWSRAPDLPFVRMLRDAVVEVSPRDEYLRVLERAGVAETPLAQQWVAAAERASSSAEPVTGAFTRSHDVAADRPHAVAYQIPLRRGQRIDVSADLDGGRPGQAFVEIFAAGSEDLRRARIAAAGVEAAGDESVLVRVQPELLRGGTLRVAASIGPALLFPVAGAGAADLHSVFGDPRDAGRRSHEGVDIFAPRGTPVLSATGGIVTRVSEGGIGGRVVWVWDFARSLHVYYAHLHEQRVTPGTRVEPGEVLGTVGNTGNARSTPPHLHFGIYAPGEGAIDPDAFIKPSPPSSASSRAASGG